MYIDKRYVATDRDGEVWIHACRPRRNEEKGVWEGGYGYKLVPPDPMLKFIVPTWEEEPADATFILKMIETKYQTLQ